MFAKKAKFAGSKDDKLKKSLPLSVHCRFISDEGVEAGSPVDLPIDITTEQLQLILNAVIESDEKTQYKFFINDDEITATLDKIIEKNETDTENIIDILYQPQALFKVRPVTRCSSSMPGHSEAVVSLSFSPDSKYLASGSGDTTVRLWDLNTETPHFTCTGHKQWVLCVVWSPDSKKVASACKAGQIIIWDPENGLQLGKTLLGHKKWINSLSWEPYHTNPECRRLASAGSDGDVRIWDVVAGQCSLVISGHKGSVTAVRWGGNGLIYTASKDRTIKIWKSENGALCRTLSGHAHWVNNLTLSTDYVLRCGPFHPLKDRNFCDTHILKEQALELYKKVCPDGIESLVSCSDDFTLYLWRSNQNKCVQRMTGHQNVVNDVKYSPDVKMIASASFDKTVRLWRANTGDFICTFRGHVQAAYILSWSADSRLILSGSKDSTLKVWCVATKKLIQELPGHADEVYGVDWSPNGAKVASGGKDKVVKIWQY